MTRVTHVWPDPFQYSLRIVGFRDEFVTQVAQADPKIFQYSLRIVGFRDLIYGSILGSISTSFSIPFESWGSATSNQSIPLLRCPGFQYSLRIVGFRDAGYYPAPKQQQTLFQYSLRIVGFRDYRSG